MLLAQLMWERPDELRADLMGCYGVCLDAAMEGAYQPAFVAALVVQMPTSCRWRVSYDEDAWWDGDRMLMAAIANSLRGLVWGMSDRDRRGPAPTPIGPRSAREGGRRVRALVMTREQLVAELRKPRREADDGTR